MKRTSIILLVLVAVALLFIIFKISTEMFMSDHGMNSGYQRGFLREMQYEYFLGEP